MKKSKKDEPKQAKKVFDVMRPGKTAAGATSRPVIVGHKPQVKDPMMSDPAETEALMDSKKKVALQPTSEISTSPTVSVEQQPEAEAPKPHDGPYVADEIASLATTNAVEQIPEGVETQQLATPLDASTPPEAVPPTFEESPQPTEAKQPEQQSAQPVPTDSNTSSTTGVVFDEVPDLETLTGTKPDANTSAEPLPKLPEAPEDKAVVQVPKVVVSHHNYSNGWVKFFVTFLVLAVIAVIVIDVLLDSGMLVKDGLPHTNFFQ
jgi:hypothetical protein